MLTNELSVCMRSSPGTSAVIVRNLRTHETAAFNEEVVFPAASLIKLFILLEFFRQVDAGELDADEKIPLLKKQQTPGYGILKELTPGLRIPFIDLATLMIILSDNTATNILIDTLGMARINTAIQQCGYTSTSLQREMMDLEAKKAGFDNVTSPKDIFTIFEDLETGTILSKKSREKFIDILKRQQCRDRLPLLMPEGTVMAHKTGDLALVQHDAGILYLNGEAIIIVVMTKDLPDNLSGVRFSNTVGSLVHNFFSR